MNDVYFPQPKVGYFFNGQFVAMSKVGYPSFYYHDLQDGNFDSELEEFQVKINTNIPNHDQEDTLTPISNFFIASTDDVHPVIFIDDTFYELDLNTFRFNCISKIPNDRIIKMISDPYNTSKVIFVTQNGELCMIDKRVSNTLLLEGNVTNFCFSKTYFATLNKEGYLKIKSRSDVDTQPIIQQKIGHSQPYIDDCYYYLFNQVDNTLNIFSIKNGSRINRLKDITSVWQSDCVISKDKNGTIYINSQIIEPPFDPDYALVAEGVVCFFKDNHYKIMKLPHKDSSENFVVDSISSLVNSFFGAVSAQLSKSSIINDSIISKMEEAAETIEKKSAVLMRGGPSRVAFPAAIIRSINSENYLEGFNSALSLDPQTLSGICDNLRLRSAIVSKQLTPPILLRITASLAGAAGPENSMAAIHAAHAALGVDLNDPVAAFAARSIYQELSETVKRRAKECSGIDREAMELLLEALRRFA